MHTWEAKQLSLIVSVRLFTESRVVAIKRGQLRYSWYRRDVCNAVQHLLYGRIGGNFAAAHSSGFSDARWVPDSTGLQ